MDVVFVLFGLIAAVAGSCPNGWVQHDTSCYHFSHDKESWINALAMCKLIGGELIEINDAEENTFVTGQIANRNYSKPFIALSDVAEENVWVWMVSNSQLTSTSYTNWADGQPNNSDGQQNCVQVNASGDWNDVLCSQVHYYVCEQTDSGAVSVVG